MKLLSQQTIINSINKLDLIIKKESVLFFDMDGTLIDTNLANFLAYKKAIQSITKFSLDIVHNPSLRINRSILKTIVPNLKKSEYERIIREKERCYKNFLPETKLIKPIADILFKYSKTNKTVLVTNCRKDRALETLEYHRLTGKFSNFFFRKLNEKGVKVNKFQNALSILGVPPNIVIAFENEEAEITDAKNAGITIINPV